MGKESVVEIPPGSGNHYRYEYVDGATVYKGPVGDGPALSEEEFLAAMVGDYDIDDVSRHFVVSLLWASTDDEDVPLDQDYDVEDMDEESMKVIKRNVGRFLEENRHILTKHKISEEIVGTDLFLDSQGHGAGFWDRGYGADGDVLSESAKKYFGDGFVFVAGGKVHLELPESKL